LLINFPNVDPTRIPTFEFDTKEPADLALFAESFPKLVDIGLQIPANWARDKLGIPEAQEGEAVLGRVAQPTQAVGLSDRVVKSPHCPCGCGGKVHAFSTQSGFDEQDFLDSSLDEALENVDFNAQLDPMIKQVVAMLHRCGSFEEASEKLAELYPKLHSKQHFDYLNKAMFLSELLGVSRAS
ncbi:DUF935 family protein, partial [Glaesserella parasuis]|nr:DUF935 family protein [Glaesserella parasuis]